MKTTNTEGAHYHPVSIDVYQQHLDVCLMPDGEEFAVTSDPEGIDFLLEQLEGTRPELLGILEANGR